VKERFSTDKDRLEAFSDGVIAVIITIMVLDLRPPQGIELDSLAPVLPTFAAYVISFIFVGIYWNNHHHMLRASRGIDGRAMWANLHFLFWLSLSPFMTSWVGAHPLAAVPTALYCVVLALDGIAYAILQYALRSVNGPDSPFARAISSRWKDRTAIALYLLAIGLAFVSTIVSDILVVVVAIVWIVPDRRFEVAIQQES
jgi:uncharacterized membrane protein